MEIDRIGGRFLVERELGRGGMGIVYLVREDGREEPLALKVLTRAYSESALRHFEHEFRTLTTLEHPNLTEVHDFGRHTLPGENREVPFFTMQFVDGETLLPHLRKSGPGHDHLFPLLAQVGQALDYLHGKGLVHQDVKPSNIMVSGTDGTDSQPGVKLMDLGLAGRPRQGAGPGFIRGTAAYIPPEAARGGTVDPRSDLYSLGCVMYEIVTGRQPFQGNTALQVLRGHLLEKPIPPSSLNREISSGLEELILKLLEKDPGLRFPGARMFLQALNDVAGGNLDVETPTIRRHRVLGGGFTGREEELRRLGELLEQARGGTNLLMLIVGESGVGKSRLLREYQVRCQLDGLDLHIGRRDGGNGSGNVVYDALARAIRAHSPIDDDLSMKYGAELAMIMGESTGDESMDQYRLLEAASEILDRIAANSPLLLAFEDLHDADEFTCALLHHLARSISRGTREPGRAIPQIVLLGTYRGDEVSRETPLFDLLAEGREEGIIEELFLNPLGAEECRSMLRAMLGAEEIPMEFLQRMLEETRGNPLYLGELIALLAEEGHLSPGTGKSPDIADLEGVELPGRTRSLLERRLELIPAEPIRVLRAVAVLGSGNVDPDAIAAITGLRWEHVVVRLLELTDLGVMIREEDDQGAPFYRLSYRGLGELAEKLIPEDEAALLHAKAVSYFERRGVPRNHAAWAELARHAELGSQPGRAIESFSRAGDLAVAFHAHREAIELFSRSVELARREPSSSTTLLCGLYMRRGDAWARSGDLSSAEEDYRWMLARAVKDGDDTLRAQAFLALGRTLTVRGKPSEALQNLDNALEIATASGNDTITISATIGIGRVAEGSGNPEEGIARFTEAEQLAGKTGSSLLQVEALLARGDLHRRIGDYRSSLTCFQKAEKSAGEELPPSVASAIMRGAALALDVQGRYGEALQALDRAKRRSLETGDSHEIASLTASLGAIHLKTGDYAAAEGEFRESLAMHRQLGSPEGIARSLQYAARTQIARGRFKEANDIAEDALRSARRLGNAEVTAGALDVLATINLRMGDLDAAASHLKEARSTMEATDNVHLKAMLLISLGDLLILEGKADEALRNFQESTFLSRKIGDHRLISTGMCRLGEAHLLENDYDRALVACGKAFDTIKESGLPLELSDSLLLRARIELERPGGDVVGAETDALEALEVYRSLGNTDMIWRAEYITGRAEIRLARSEEGFERIDRSHRYLEKLHSRLDGGWRNTFLTYPMRRDLYDDWERLRKGVSKQPGEEAVSAHAGEYSRLKEEAAALQRLLEINRILNSTRETDQLLHVILEEALELTGAERGFLLLRDGKEVTPRKARDSDGTALDGESLALSRSIAGKVMESGEPLLSTDAEADERFSQYESVHDLHIRSVMALPMRIQDTVAGALYLDSRLDRKLFSREQMQLAERLADQAGLALDTARMLAEIEEQRSHLERLNLDLEQTIAAQRDQLELAREELSSSRTSFELRYRFEKLVGASLPMQRVYHLIEKLAPKNIPVLVIGESGTGKELIARALHSLGTRKEGPFFTVNCAALTESLLESELFGYKKGAFTGADRDKPGYFELADGGTLFLDEIGEMGQAMQAKLLRAIEKGEVMPVGGKASAIVDVRILAATHRDLRTMIADGTFREDLFYRINVGRIEIPPLRERRDDIALLVDHFLSILAEEEDQEKREMEPAVIRAMAAYHWPGNVRELQHQVLRVSTFARKSTITLKDLQRYGDLSAGVPDAGPSATGAARRPEEPLESLEEMEKKQIIRAVEEARGNKTRAAEILGINRATLFRKIKKFSLDL